MLCGIECGIISIDPHVLCRRFAMMRALMHASDDDDSLLDFLRQAERAPFKGSSDTTNEPRRTRSTPARNSGDAAAGSLVEDEEASLTRERKELAMHCTPAKPARPDVRELGKSELEQAAWQYVHQHQLRDQVSFLYVSLRDLKAYKACVCGSRILQASFV